MDLRKAFGTDSRLETEGVDIHLGGGAYVTIARAGGSNARYESAMRRHLAPHQKALALDALDEKTAAEIMSAAYAETVVLGWRGIELDGEPVPFSVDTAKRLFRELPEFWRVVRDEAGKFANFRAQEVNALGES